MYAHREADILIPKIAEREYTGVLQAISKLTDERIISEYTEEKKHRTNLKSISASINRILKDELVQDGWISEAQIFQDSHYSRKDGPWRLDFAKGDVSIEVGFNHGEATSWNLIKLSLAGSLNHVKKAVQTKFGILICATQELKVAGNLDSAVGTYDKYVEYLKPLQNMLTTPTLIIGLRAPDSFTIDPETKNVAYNSQASESAGVSVSSRSQLF